jgi:glutamate formiminotransferase/formiminotetrahydrofolate cyclodeaminase
MEAEARGVTPTWSEIVGLVPERVLFEAAARHIRLKNFSPDMVLERKVRMAQQGGESLSGFVASVASNTPTPGGGSVAAHAGALAAALAQMVAGLTIGKKKYAAVEPEMKEAALRAAGLGNRLAALVAEDAAAYDRVAAAYKLPGEGDAAEGKKQAITNALLDAARVPLETARAAADVAELALLAARKGNQNALSDAGVAALLADTACRGAAFNVRINVSSLDDKSAGAPLVAEVRELVANTRRIAAEVEQLVDASLG